MDYISPRAGSGLAEIDDLSSRRLDFLAAARDRVSSGIDVLGDSFPVARQRVANLCAAVLGGKDRFIELAGAQVQAAGAARREAYKDLSRHLVQLQTELDIRRQTTEQQRLAAEFEKLEAGNRRKTFAWQSEKSRLRGGVSIPFGLRMRPTPMQSG